MLKKIPHSFKKFAACLFFLTGSLNCLSQNPASKSDFWNHVRFGGSIGLGFTNGGFNGSIAPSAIYQFNDQFALGTSLNFNYFKFNETKCTPLFLFLVKGEVNFRHLPRTKKKKKKKMPKILNGPGMKTQT